MESSDLTDAQWSGFVHSSHRGSAAWVVPAKDHRTIVNGMLWILRTGSPWRALPERYGSRKTVSSRFDRWQRAGMRS